MGSFGKGMNGNKTSVLLGTLIVLMMIGAIAKSNPDRSSLPSGRLYMLQIWTLLAAPNLPVTGTQMTEAEKIDAFVNEAMQRHHLPGLALAVVEGNRVTFIKGYGKADPSGRPVTPQTPFLLASVSKPLTAAAIMQLVDAGRVDLDTPVQKYISEFRVGDPVASGQITVRHLLLHTSGLPVTACDTRINAQTLAEYVAELQTVKLEAPVGARHSYCSGNYNILGRVIEKVSGQTFGGYMQQNVFAPLEMRNSFISEKEAQAAGMAQGYQFLFGISVPTHYAYNPSQLPSGYMISSAEDMSHFLISQLNEGQYEKHSLLSADKVASMHMPGTSRGREGGYGFGWVIAPFGDIPAVWHDGVNNNYHSLLLMEPQNRRGVVILMNSFNVVAYEGAYQEIESGVARLLAGVEPNPPAQTLGQTYLKIDIVLFLLLAIVLWPLIRIGKWHRWLLERQQAGKIPMARVVLRAALEISFALFFLIVIRMVIVTGLGAQSWYEVLTAFPDFVLWIWAFALILLVTGIIRVKLILQIRCTSIRQDRLISETPVL
jgi:CubicO group peptidase (beta-lactamase class C family)